MRYSICEIIHGMLLCWLCLTVIDTYVNLDNYRNYCCCNLNISQNNFSRTIMDDIFASNQYTVRKLLINNSFCVSGNPEEKSMRLAMPIYLYFQKSVQKILSNAGIKKNGAGLRFYQATAPNHYCKMIGEQDVLAVLNGFDQDFWNRCSTFNMMTVTDIGYIQCHNWNCFVG